MEQTVCRYKNKLLPLKDKTSIRLITSQLHHILIDLRKSFRKAFSSKMCNKMITKDLTTAMHLLFIKVHRMYNTRCIAETGQDRTKVYYWWPIESRIRAFDWCQNQRPWMTLKGHCALCFKTRRASFRAHHENLSEDRRPEICTLTSALDHKLCRMQQYKMLTTGALHNLFPG